MLNKKRDAKETLERVRLLKESKIGSPQRWNEIIKKLESYQKLAKKDIDYFTNMTRIYKDGKRNIRSKIYHTRLSVEDEKPKCHMCGRESSFYCNMNDAYFCHAHIVGHDENEL